MMKFWQYIRAQLGNPAAWRGLIMVAGAVGLISSEHADQLGPCADIIAFAFAGSGAVGMLAPKT